MIEFERYNVCGIHSSGQFSGHWLLMKVVLHFVWGCRLTNLSDKNGSTIDMVICSVVTRTYFWYNLILKASLLSVCLCSKVQYCFIKFISDKTMLRDIAFSPFSLEILVRAHYKDDRDACCEWYLSEVCSLSNFFIKRQDTNELEWMPTAPILWEFSKW